jgi:hypothetical protein
MMIRSSGDEQAELVSLQRSEEMTGMTTEAGNAKSLHTLLKELQDRINSDPDFADRVYWDPEGVLVDAGVPSEMIDQVARRDPDEPDYPVPGYRFSGTPYRMQITVRQYLLSVPR